MTPSPHLPEANVPSSPNEGDGGAAPPPADDHDPSALEHVRSFLIVGVGASAGGLEAFSELLEALPPDPGLAILFVVHLQPDHKSEMVSLLARHTALQVQEAAAGMTVEVGHVYIIPPGSNMALHDGTIALTPRSASASGYMPVDHLFRSLARSCKAQAIGVILSGGGTDGTLGFQEIKAEGGITFAQDEKSARHSSMPRSAATESAVDFILPPREIARQLVRLARHPYAHKAPPPREEPAESGDTLEEILNLLRSSTDVDFTYYKRTTINRRIQRRMALLGFEQTEDYLRRLREDPGELHSLYQDFLIRVTQFFRDPEAYRALAEKVFPALVQRRSPGQPIRIWVAGCATGEEAYSLAICLLEFLSGRQENLPIKILATDLSEAALERARAGVYVDNIEIDVSPERLRRFFVRVGNHYQISKSVRDLCVFSRHNLAADPPFSRLDLVSCRNVLIYMNATLQKRVLPLLHYALNPDGFLFLGNSENIGPFSDLFATVDSKFRIFSKRPGNGAVPLDFGSSSMLEGISRRSGKEGGPPLWSALDVQKEADRIVLSRYAPVGVVIDETMTVLQFRGRTSAYLEPAPGLASLDMLRMLREGLLSEVRAAITQAKAENTIVVREGARISEDNQVRRVTVEVIPFKMPTGTVRFFLVLFRDSDDRAPAEHAAGRVGRREAQEPPAAEGGAGAPPAGVTSEAQVLQLQQELTALREYLQSVIEEQESTNEELKSANEEILSANEELQSTNEELQTAKEEAQSANEELATVNEELRHRNADLARVNNDLINLLASVNIPIVMVSRDLRIRRFTPLAEKLFNLIPTDVGRPIGDIKSNLVLPDLDRRITEVIDTLKPHESEVQDRDGRWYSLVIRPYVTLESKIDGASVVVLDIDSIKRGIEGRQQKTTEDRG